MMAEDHLFFSIARAVSAKNAELTPVLAQDDWWRIALSAILMHLLPDIGYPKSLFRQRLKWISKPIARAFGYRGFIHSLLAVFALLTAFYLKIPENWFIPTNALQDVVLSYLSHVLADMLTLAGVPLLWPRHWRFRLPILVPQKDNQLERFICMALFVWSVWMPHSLPKNSAVRWSSQVANTLQIQFHRLIEHQVEY